MPSPPPPFPPSPSSPLPSSSASPSPSGWTELRISRLEALLADGLSASQIAAALGGGVTRNAVIGKIHRLGLAGGQNSAPPGARRATTPAAAARRAGVRRGGTSAPRRPPPPPPRPPSAPVSAGPGRSAPPLEAAPLYADLAALPGRACRWPIGDPRLDRFGFCGRAAPRAPYCETHRLRAYRPSLVSAPPPGREPARRTG